MKKGILSINEEINYNDYMNGEYLSTAHPRNESWYAMEEDRLTSYMDKLENDLRLYEKEIVKHSPIYGFTFRKIKNRFLKEFTFIEELIGTLNYIRDNDDYREKLVKDIDDRLQGLRSQINIVCSHYLHQGVIQ